MINSISKRYIFSVIGNKIPTDEINNIYDFTDWVNSHPGGSNSILKWRQNNNILVYPHSLSRWYSFKSRFEYVGKREELIKYNDLPDNLKSEELFNKIIWDNNKKKTIKNQVEFMEDLGFENDKIISHLQTRDKDLTWQTYYSTVPQINNLLILTHSQSIELDGKGTVKIKSNKNDNPDIVLNHFGK